MEKSKKIEEQEIFELINKASQQYEQYLQITAVSTSTILKEPETKTGKPTWSHPLGLVINEPN